MAKYKTALGKVLDMSVLIAKNEKTRAVGNMKVNARGDTIDSKGNIVKRANEKANDNYNKAVGNKSAQPTKNTAPAQKTRHARPQTISKKGVNQKIADTELTDMEKELESDLDHDLAVEKIKAAENRNV